tara:strand:- start:630 stop:1346 length:717 start_codon:yes stop_codon:yes gene_type:complete
MKGASMPTKAKKSTAKAVPVQQPDPEVISIRVLEERELTIPIEGVTPLIMNEFGHKSKEQMLESMQGKKVNTKERPPKDPLEDYKHARIILPKPVTIGGVKCTDGVKASAFKAATVTAARAFPQMTLVLAKTQIFVLGTAPGDPDLIPIIGEPNMRTDLVRNANGSPDLRTRAEYKEWGAILHVQYQPEVMDADSVLALVQQGGRGGVGEWRAAAPKSYSGSYGKYKINMKKVEEHGL